MHKPIPDKLLEDFVAHMNSFPQINTCSEEWWADCCGEAKAFMTKHELRGEVDDAVCQWLEHEDDK